MAIFDFINLLPRHVAINYLKLKSYTSKIQRIVSSIGFIRSPAGNYMFKVNNRNTRTRCEICSKLTIKTPERRH